MERDKETGMKYQRNIEKKKKKKKRRVPNPHPKIKRDIYRETRKESQN